MIRKVDIAIIGAGPAGMFLAHLLHQHGRSVTVLEARDRDYVEGRVRAGVLEQSTIDVMARLELADRARAEGLRHLGVNLVMDGESFRIDLGEHTAGAGITVYGQQEVMHDLFEASITRGINVVFEAENVSLPNFSNSDRSSSAVCVRWQNGGKDEELECDFVIGCDGSHGVSQEYIPSTESRTYVETFPFAWLGILAEVPPASEELIYGSHAHGFTLASMRSPTRSRYYVQCAIGDSVDAWPDERVWNEVELRLGPSMSRHVTRGASFDKSITPLRSLVMDPMSYGRLFLAGDAAHIVPPTGAKGLNLAVSDVTVLAQALGEYFDTGSERALKAYSSVALARVWKAQRFCWWFTMLTHRNAQDSGYRQQLQRAEFDYLRSSTHQQQVFAENYVGLPLAGSIQ